MNSLTDRHCHAFPVRVWTDANGKMRKSPAVPKGVDWHAYNSTSAELAEAPNIGIVVPADIVVLDVDSYRGVRATDVERALGCGLDWAHAVLQKTVSGGFHLAFALPRGAEVRQGANVLGIAGLDTRTAGKGWICTGAGYKAGPHGDVLAALDHDAFPVFPAPACHALAQPEAPPLAILTVIPPGAGAPAVIAEGGRNDSLMRAGVWWARHGFGESRVLAELTARNARCCTPPLAQEEVRKIARSVMRYWEPRGSSDSRVDRLVTDQRWARRLPRGVQL